MMILETLRDWQIQEMLEEEGLPPKPTLSEAAGLIRSLREGDRPKQAEIVAALVTDEPEAAAALAKKR